MAALSHDTVLCLSLVFASSSATTKPRPKCSKNYNTKRITYVVTFTTNTHWKKWLECSILFILSVFFKTLNLKPSKRNPEHRKHTSQRLPENGELQERVSCKMWVSESVGYWSESGDWRKLIKPVHVKELLTDSSAFSINQSTNFQRNDFGTINAAHGETTSCALTTNTTGL